MKLTLILLLSSFTLFAQNIEGVVLDFETNKPLEHVNIFSKKENTGTTSNIKGEFILDLKSEIDKNDTIHFSSIGYSSHAYTFSELKENNFVVYLVRKVENLKEITITSNRVLKPEIRFKKLSSLEKGIHSFGSELVNGKIYVIGGDASYIEDAARRTLDEISNTPEATLADFIKKSRINSTWEKYTGKLQIYDISKDTWTSSELKFRERAYHTINYYNNLLYVLGGKYFSRNKKLEYLDDKIEVFDLKNQSITIDNTNPHQATNFESFVYNNSIIVMGGSIKMAKDGKKTFSNKVHLYDLKTGYWYKLNDMPKGKEVKGLTIKNTIYLVGGYNNRPLSEIESYNIVTGKWKNEGELFYGIENPALTFYENVIYIFNDGKILTYNIVTKVLNEYEIDLDLMSSELYYYNNKLYILGGYISDEFSKSPSPNLYSIDINEFLNTKIISSKK